jgi:hypothetical protein
MANCRKAEPPSPLVPRLGPPENLRPAGTHRDKRRKTRAEEKAALRRAAFEGGAALAASTAPVLRRQAEATRALAWTQMTPRY